MTQSCTELEWLMTFSDEILVLIVRAVSLSDIGNLRLTCRKMNALAEPLLFKDLYVPIAEARDEGLAYLKAMPTQIMIATSLTILNRPRALNSLFWPDGIIPRDHTTRIYRWRLQDDAIVDLWNSFARSAFFTGSLFNWKTRLQPNQLNSFKWLHAIPISTDVLSRIVIEQANSLKHLEISMIEPAVDEEHICGFADEFSNHVSHIQTFAYRGLSYTEPLPINGRPAQGRFRMIRPLLRRSIGTLKSLVLTQEHCISQIGRTPFLNGHTFHSTLCDLDEIYIDPSQTFLPDPITLRLNDLELGGFDVSDLAWYTLTTSRNRIKFEISHLRRLILSDCDGVETFLTALGLQASRKRVHLKEFGVRFEYDSATTLQRQRAAAANVVPFLMSFTGLEVLSVMCKEPISIKLPTRVFQQHSDTLQVLVNDARATTPSEFHSDHPFLQHSSDSSGAWESLLLDGSVKSAAPNLLEASLSLGADRRLTEYPALRLLSCYQRLRTVHVRNFVPIEHTHRTDDRSPFKHWRNPGGAIPTHAISYACAMAESMTRQAVDARDWNVLSSDTTHVLAKTTSQAFVRQKYGELFGIKSVRLPPSSDSFSESWLESNVRLPGDVVYQLARHKSGYDDGFRTLMTRIKNGAATSEEYQQYQMFAMHAQQCMSLLPSTDKPQLKLLIIGDWRYRDRFNLAGPRSWDPEAWYSSKERLDTWGSKSPAAMTDEELEEEEYERVTSGGYRYTFHAGFQRHFSTLTVPIFFRIDWRQEKNCAGRWEWKAMATPIEYSAVKDDGDYSIRSLDFAWQA